MSVSMYENAVRRHRSDLAKQRAKQADEEKKAAKAEQDALRAEQEARRSTSPSTISQKMRRADSKRKDMSHHRSRAAQASNAVAKAQSELGKAEEKLGVAYTKEQKKQNDSREAARKQAERRAAEDERRAVRLQRAAETAHGQELAGLRHETADLRERVLATARAQAPERITVLFVSANPDTGEPPLRLGREVREIQRRVRTSDLRDILAFEIRPASRVTDLLDHLNEVRPHIVHFSGHGSQDALLFEDADGQPQPLDNEFLARVLATNSKRIRLAVFNSCNSASQAILACDHLPAAIGMDRPVDDEAAKVFAGQFYNSLGFGKTLSEAFEEARVQTELALGTSSGEPKLYVADGLEADEMVLVSPGSARAA